MGGWAGVSTYDFLAQLFLTSKMRCHFHVYQELLRSCGSQELLGLNVRHFLPAKLGESSIVHWLGTAIAKPLLYIGNILIKEELFAIICLVCVRIFVQIKQRLTVKSVSY